MMKLGLLVFAVCCLVYAQIQAQNICVQRNSCSCVFSDKRVVDLSPLAFNNGTPRWSELWDGYYTSRYSFNPCFNFTEVNCTGVAVCRFDGAYYTSLGSQQSATFVTNATNGRQAIVYNSTDSRNVTRSTTVELVCIYEGPDTLSVHGEVDSLHYYIANPPQYLLVLLDNFTLSSLLSLAKRPTIHVIIEINSKQSAAKSYAAESKQSLRLSSTHCCPRSPAMAQRRVYGNYIHRPLKLK